MYFCFDLMDETLESSDVNGLPTVAVTCPKKELPKDTKIVKCCPPGQVLDRIEYKCLEQNSAFNITEKWRLQINGHFYDGYKDLNSLYNTGVLVHDNSNIVSLNINILFA